MPLPVDGHQLQVDKGDQKAPEGRPLGIVVAQAGRAARAHAVVGAERVPWQPLDKRRERVLQASGVDHLGVASRRGEAGLVALGPASLIHEFVCQVSCKTGMVRCQ